MSATEWRKGCCGRVINICIVADSFRGMECVALAAFLALLFLETRGVHD
jgi:hypothetical protein